MFIQHFMMDLITYQCWDKRYPMSVKVEPGNEEISWNLEVNHYLETEHTALGHAFPQVSDLIKTVVMTLMLVAIYLSDSLSCYLYSIIAAGNHCMSRFLCITLEAPRYLPNLVGHFEKYLLLNENIFEISSRWMEFEEYVWFHSQHCRWWRPEPLYRWLGARLQ